MKRSKRPAGVGAFTAHRTSAPRQFKNWIWSAVLCVVCVVAARPACAQVESGSPIDSVSLHPPAKTDTFMDEAIIRTLGELNALGFQVVVAPASGRPEPGVPSLSFFREGKSLVVEAFCPDCGAPVRQLLEVGSPEMSPDVAAVRAVEALRAALLDYSERTQRSLPGAFIEYQRPPLRPRPVAPAAVLPPAPAPDVPTVPTLHEGFRIGLELAPTSLVEVTPLASAVGWYAALFIESRNLGLQLQADGPFRDRVFERPAGRAQVSSLRVGAALRLRRELSPAWTLGINAGGGVARYGVQTTPNPGFVGQDVIHVSPYVGAQFVVHRAFTRSVALMLAAGATLATDSPVVTVAGADVGTLGVPTLFVALGIELAADTRTPTATAAPVSKR